MPYTYFGPFGSQFGTFAEPAGGNAGTKPLGTKLVLPDERLYRYALHVALAVPGNLYSSIAPVADHTNVVSDQARAIGATSLSATLGATAAAVDIYSEGYVHTNDLTGEGFAFRIKRAIASGQANAAAAASAILTVALEAGESVQVATAATADLTFRRNRFHTIIIAPSTPVAGTAGVAAGATAADRYGYVQTKGYAAVFTQGTLLIADPAVHSLTTAGCAMPSVAVETDGPILGQVVAVNATTEYSLLNLVID